MRTAIIILNPAICTGRIHRSGLCMLEGFIGRTEQANERVRRYRKKGSALR